MPKTTFYSTLMSAEELDLLIEALDSHEYWQLSDEVYRDDGFVRDPGSDDEENAEEIQDCRRLTQRLEAIKETIRDGSEPGIEIEA